MGVIENQLPGSNPDEPGGSLQLIADQREANERLITAIVQAQEDSDRASDARLRAEASERQLREIAEVRELFIAILGHDLRTPLTSILVAAETLLSHGHLVEEDAKSVARIVRGSRRMTAMIGQLLDFAQARLGGGMQIEVKASDFRQICQGVIEEFPASATIRLHAEGDLGGVWDADRLGQALSNIVGNAVEHATPGTGVVIDARAAADNVVLEVRNHGAAIAEALAPVIFEPFRRGVRSQSRNSGHLGLGLYVAKQIVLAHGGALTAGSSSGVTTFKMSLPRESTSHRAPARHL